MNVTFTGLTGSSVTVDADTVDPATGVVALTALQRRTQGVSQGTQLTDSGAVVRLVQEAVEIVKTVLRSARTAIAGIGNTTTSAPVAPQTVLNATPALLTAAAIAPRSGTYRVEFHGTASSTAAATTGLSVQATVAAAPVGDTIRWDPAQMIGNNVNAFDLGMLGMQPLVLVAGQSVSAFVTPQGGAGNITVTGAQVTLTQIS